MRRLLWVALLLVYYEIAVLLLSEDEIDARFPLHLCDARRKVLFGVFSVASKGATRDALRGRRRACQLAGEGQRTVFVAGRPGSAAERLLLLNESQAHGDLLVLSCRENMNEGKSYVYFKEAAELFPCFDYYAKVDDDTAFAPARIASSLPDDPGELFAGRSPSNLDLDWSSYLTKCIKWGFRDMSWLRSVERYNAGMLYVISRRAVELWVGLRPAGLYGDEDLRTSYYMGRVGARFLDFGTAFHDYERYRPPELKEHWKLPITNGSLAVHQCKSIADYSDALDELCALHS